MKSLKYLFLFVISLTILASCKKDEATVNTKNEILTAHSWKIFSSKVNGVSDMENCENDNVLTFFANNTHTYSPGSIKCDPQETMISGTWILSGDGIYLSITENGNNGDNNEYTATIIELTQSKLITNLVEGSNTIEHIFIPL